MLQTDIVLFYTILMYTTLVVLLVVGMQQHTKNAWHFVGILKTGIYSIMDVGTQIRDVFADIYAAYISNARSTNIGMQGQAQSVYLGCVVLFCGHDVFPFVSYVYEHIADLTALHIGTTVAATNAVGPEMAMLLYSWLATSLECVWTHASACWEWCAGWFYTPTPTPLPVVVQTNAYATSWWHVPYILKQVPTLYLWKIEHVRNSGHTYADCYCDHVNDMLGGMAAGVTRVCTSGVLTQENCDLLQFWAERANLIARGICDSWAGDMLCTPRIYTSAANDTQLTMPSAHHQFFWGEQHTFMNAWNTNQRLVQQSPAVLNAIFADAELTNYTNEVYKSLNYIRTVEMSFKDDILRCRALRHA